MKHYLLFIILVLLTSQTHAQTFVYAGFGATNFKLSADLQVGQRWKGKFSNLTTSVGLTTMPDGYQPVFLSAQAGLVVSETFLVFGGYAKAMKSGDDSRQNKNTFQVGGQWHFMYAVNKRGKTGTMYVEPMYTYPNYYSVHIGLTLNLINRE